MAKSYGYKPKNWSAYNQSKVQQGNLFIWISEDIEDWWYDTMPQKGKGRSKRYSNGSVECCQTLRSLLHFPLRQTQVYFEGIFSSSKGSQLNINRPQNSGPWHLVWCFRPSGRFKRNDRQQWCAISPRK